MEYTVTISTKEFQTLVVEHTCMQIELNQVQAKLTDESWKNYQALKAVKEELEKTRKELDAAWKAVDEANESMLRWKAKARKLGYTGDGEAE